MDATVRLEGKEDNVVDRHFGVFAVTAKGDVEKLG